MWRLYLWFSHGGYLFVEYSLGWRESYKVPRYIRWWASRLASIWQLPCIKVKKQRREPFHPWVPNPKELAALEGTVAIPCQGWCPYETPAPRCWLSDKGRRGLLNLGQTCFLNVVLQSFVHNPLLRNYFLSDKHNEKLCKSTDCTCCEMDRLFAEVRTPFYIVEEIWSWNFIDIFKQLCTPRSHLFPPHHMARLYRPVRICPTRCSRILHSRPEPDPHHFPRLNQCFL